MTGVNFAVLAAVGGAGVTVIDDGDVASEEAGGTTDTHTFSSETSTGPDTILCATWIGGFAGAVTLTSATWNGSPMTILVQANEATASLGAAICYISGAQSGDIVLTFSNVATDSAITKLSLVGLSSSTAIDTDSESSAAGGADLDSLSSPGSGGVRIATFANATSGTGVTWTNATEVADTSAGSYRHSAGYDSGADATAITADGAAAGEVIVGVSLR